MSSIIKMRRNRFYAVLLAGLAMFCITACAAGDGAEQPEEAVSYGSSANMKHAGLVEADEDNLFFVWEDELLVRKEDTGEIRTLDARGADSLCLTPDGLFYGSCDEQGRRGIYRLDISTGERTLVYQADFTSLYAAVEELFFLDQGNVCSVSKDGNGFRVIYEGGFEALSVEGNKIFFRDRESGAYYVRVLGEEKNVLSEMDILFTDSGRSAPVVTDGWVYYDSGQWMKAGRIRTDRSENQQLEIDGSTITAQGAYSYNGSLRTDWDSGETAPWTDSTGVRFIGFAGDRILYEACTYDPERLTDAALIPQEVELIAHDRTGTSPDLSLGVRLQANAPLKTEQAEERFMQLLAGHKRLLRNEAPGFFEALESQEPVRWRMLDADQDRSEELYVRTSSAGYLFHASADGIYCWMAEPFHEDYEVEPLTDGTFLYRTIYRAEGIVQEMFDIHEFRPGGESVRINTLQHLQLDPAQLELEAREKQHIKEHTYYVKDSFVTRDQWEQAVESHVTQMTVSEDGYETYGRKQTGVAE